MVTRVATVAFQGIEAVPVDVQVQIAPACRSSLLVGLPDKAVKESSERVHAALYASGLSLPPKRITVNLAPADLPKEGSHYDLPIALGLMAAIGAIPSDALAGYLALGELGLDGRLAPTAGRTAGRHRRAWRATSASSVPRRPGPKRPGPARTSTSLPPQSLAGAGQPSRRLPALRRGRWRDAAPIPPACPT